MRIKRFEAPDNQTALRMVKEEMGDEALILATRSLSPAERKAGSNARVEVVAAVDFDEESVWPTAAEPGGDAAPSPPEMTYDYSIRRRPMPAMAPAEQKKQPGRTASTAPARPAPSSGPTARRNTVPPPAGNIQPGKPAGRLSTKPDRETVARWREQLIDQLTVRTPLLERQEGRPAILALIGATGVGKTTTAAKLAAWYSLREGLRVTLLSMDCYRIGATDQLRTYAKIMRLPCEIVLNPGDLQRAIERHAGQDLLIIDTAGKSPYNDEHIDELALWFEEAQEIQPYLVLSATTKKEDLAHTIRTYQPLHPAGLMVTKLDETRAYAAICQQLAVGGLPVAALAFGQRVPEDFMMASRDFLATLFREGWNVATSALGAA